MTSGIESWPDYARRVEQQVSTCAKQLEEERAAHAETKRLLKRLLDVLREVPPKVSYGDAALYAAVVHWSSDVEWVNEGFEQDLHECLVDLEKAVAP